MQSRVEGTSDTNQTAYQKRNVVLPTRTPVGEGGEFFPRHVLEIYYISIHSEIPVIATSFIIQNPFILHLWFSQQTATVSSHRINRLGSVV
jgi:hypothetical protein